MAEPQYVSTSDVAAALGVSVTTVKRWVDENILPARRTAGGHRKLLLADVLRVVREENFPHADLTRLQAASFKQTPPDPEALAAELTAALRGGDLAAARSVIQGSYQAGLAFEILADQVVAPAMRQLGNDWEKGRIDVLHEHRGTQVCATALYELRAGFEGRPGRQRPVALGAAPEGDWSTLPTLLAQMILLDGGWDAINFGPCTPLPSLRKALVEFRPRLLWLSVTHEIDAEPFLRQYRELYHEAQRAGCAVALGGRVLTAEVRAGMLYTTFGDGLTHLAAFARSLHPRPRRPRRGRPRRTT